MLISSLILQLFKIILIYVLGIKLNTFVQDIKFKVYDKYPERTFKKLFCVVDNKVHKMFSFIGVCLLLLFVNEVKMPVRPDLQVCSP